jgi:hypothetical protein
MSSHSAIGAGAGPAPSDVSSRIADALASLGDFKTTPWTPETGIRVDEEAAFADPHEEQYLAALKACAHMFVATKQRIWVHLAAEMQAGKTGVIATVARLILANYKRLAIASDRIFVVTGMSDEAWQTQTADRLPAALRENVYHGATLSKVAEKLIRLARGEELKNIMVFIDESHYATGATNQTAKQVYDTLARLCPRTKWADNNIRLMTISATDPAKVLAMKASEVPCAVVRLGTTDAYQSVEKLQALNRIRYLEQVPGSGVLHTETGFKTLANAVVELEATHGPLIHIVRPQNGKGSAVADSLRARFPGAVVHQWDMASNKEKQRLAKEESASGVGSASDINDAILNNAPETTTFVMLKGMFRAAKTLNDRYVGVLYDRVGAADATNLQSLLGRACGYGKSTRTVVFTSQSTVTNYLRCWRELCASKEWEAAEGDDMVKLGGKMPHTRTVKSVSGEDKLVTTKTHATPLGRGVGAATAEELAASMRATLDDDNYTVEWSVEFASVEALKASKLTSGKMPELNESGFYKNATGVKKPMSRAQLMALQSGKKTAHLRGELEVGKPSKRTFPFYEVTTDSSTVKFIVRTLTRIR